MTTSSASRWSASSGLRLLTALLCAVTPAAASGIIARSAPAKPAATILRRSDDGERIALKLAEGTGARLRGGRIGGSGVDADALAAVLAKHGVGGGQLDRMFARSESHLDRDRTRGERHGGRALADLNLYYRLRVPAGGDAAALCDDLNRLPFVELAAPMPRPAPLPVDLSPPTDDFADGQDYRRPAPFGIGVDNVTAVPGADGAEAVIVDLEYSWVLDHEDLELLGANIDSATPIDPFPDDGNHGTAVLGELVAAVNQYGVTGLAPAAAVLVAPTNTAEFGFDVGRAVDLATELLRAGDVILIEQQICICGRECDFDTQDGLGPVEDYQPWYDAIAAATAMGITVVEAAGNGNKTLDDPACGGRYDRSRRDSGAIIVGAGDRTRARVPSSSWGRRIDLQGWGAGIITTGYGDLFDPFDVRQRYTARFGGTSGASPIVTAAAAIVQSVRRAHGLAPLSPVALRRHLVDTGTAESQPAFHIGPLPDLARALADFPPPTRTLPPTATTRPTQPPTSTATPSRTRTATPSPLRRELAEIVRAIFRGGALDPNHDGRPTAADLVCALRGPVCAAP